MKQRTGSIALVAVMTALALVFLLLTLTPVATVALAALAGICGIPVVVTLGRKVGWLHYAAASLLSLWLIPAWEGKLMYLCFFGWYTVFKGWMESRSLPRWGEYTVKILSFLVALGVWGWLCYTLLSPTLPEGFGWWMIAPAAVVLAALFLAYDRCLSGLVSLYLTRLHPQLKRLFGF